MDELKVDYDRLLDALTNMLTTIWIACDEGYELPPTSKMMVDKADKLAVELCAKD